MLLLSIAQKYHYFQRKLLALCINLILFKGINAANDYQKRNSLQSLFYPDKFYSFACSHYFAVFYFSIFSYLRIILNSAKIWYTAFRKRKPNKE